MKYSYQNSHFFKKGLKIKSQFYVDNSYCLINKISKAWIRPRWDGFGAVLCLEPTPGSYVILPTISILPRYTPTPHPNTLRLPFIRGLREPSMPSQIFGECLTPFREHLHPIKSNGSIIYYINHQKRLACRIVKKEFLFISTTARPDLKQLFPGGWPYFPYFIEVHAPSFLPSQNVQTKARHLFK